VAHLLRNDRLEITIDPPGQGYTRSRFDWTGQIRTVRFAGRSVTGVELPDGAPDTPCGRGFYNEFGIDSPLGFAEAPVGGWFHKIGIGRLRKTAEPYAFHRAYEIDPADFTVAAAPDRVRITCRAPRAQGLAYVLDKEISLLPSGFRIAYHLENTGDRPIVTNEYVHNFLALDHAPIGSDYVLSFPFAPDPAHCTERVDPEDLVRFAGREIRFARTPREPFFFSNLSNDTPVAARWTLAHRTNGLYLSETGDFTTPAINLWGMGHVVSPELFIPLRVAPGQGVRWMRTYAVGEV
jgi:hypothetical protein